MENIKDKIVFITGASSGFGMAIAKLFAEHGAKIIIAARRTERLNDLKKELENKLNTKILAITMDVRNQKQVEEKISSLFDEWKPIDILVNNAGLSRGLDKIYEGKIQDWEEMIDTNVKGLLYVTKAILPDMVKRNSGHIINIGSTAGHEMYPNGNVYAATKHAVFALSKGMKMDLLGTKIRVSSVDPGMAETEFSNVRFRGDNERVKNVYAKMTPLKPEDIADAVLFCATRPPHVNINEIIMMPTDQSGSMLVHRKNN